MFFLNALLFCLLILKRGIQHKNKANLWLAFFIFLGAMYISPFMFGYAGWYAKAGYRDFLFFVPFQQLFLIGPVLYVYTKSQLNKSFRMATFDYIHFAPAILYFLYTLIVYVTDVFLLDSYYFYADGRDQDLDFWYQMSGLISMLIYLFLSIRYYRRYIKITIEEASFADEISFKWLERFMLAFSIILVLRVLFFVLNPEWGEFGSKYWYYLCFSILMLYIAITGYASSLQSSLRLKMDVLVQDHIANEISVEKTDVENTAAWIAAIEHCFENDKIYTNPNLTLTELANRLNTNRSIISQVINQTYQMNFNDFVNSKRVEAIIKELKNGRHHQHTLLAIALDCGFNAKSTFNRAFKKYTKVSPQQYIKNQKL